MKKILLLLALMCLFFVPGCSDDTSKWNAGTKLYQTVNGKEEYYATVISGHGTGVTIRMTGSNPYSITTNRDMLARRGVYAK